LPDPVGKPPVKEGFVGWASFCQAKIAFALERIQRAEQDGFSFPLSSQLQECVERG
jgi:hypothetical protein